MAKTELFGTGTCVYTAEMREWLEWNGRAFVEYDVERDAEALARMRAATGGQTTVPVLLEDGKVAQIGWHGRGCALAGGSGPPAAKADEGATSAVGQALPPANRVWLSASLAGENACPTSSTEQDSGGAGDLGEAGHA